MLHVPDNNAAFSAVQEKPFDLIVTGENTSGKADLELLRKIRRIRPHTRLIVLTSESTPADVIALMRQSAFSYFSKPFSPASLAEIVRVAAEGRTWDDGIEVISATPFWLSVLARCDRQTADRLLQFLGEIADLPEPERSEVATAFREMLLNAIEHAAVTSIPASTSNFPMFALAAWCCTASCCAASKIPVRASRVTRSAMPPSPIHRTIPSAIWRNGKLQDWGRAASACCSHSTSLTISFMGRKGTRFCLVKYLNSAQPATQSGHY